MDAVRATRPTRARRSSDGTWMEKNITRGILARGGADAVATAREGVVGGGDRSRAADRRMGERRARRRACVDAVTDE